MELKLISFPQKYLMIFKVELFYPQQHREEAVWFLMKNLGLITSNEYITSFKSTFKVGLDFWKFLAILDGSFGLPIDVNMFDFMTQTLLVNLVIIQVWYFG